MPLPRALTAEPALLCDVSAKPVRHYKQQTLNYEGDTNFYEGVKLTFTKENITPSIFTQSVFLTMQKTIIKVALYIFSITMFNLRV